MTAARQPNLRIYRADDPASRGPAPPAEADHPGAHAPGTPVPSPDAHSLATRELLRPPGGKAACRPGPGPFTRGWFEALEVGRYARHGAWLRRALEFTRHSGEAVLVVGPGLGTDAAQYARHGARVTVCTTPDDHPDLVRANFAFRDHPVTVAAALPGPALPFDRWAFDLAYLNLLHAPPADVGRLAAEAARVLKPGGKLLALAPARYDAGFWQDVLLPVRRLYRPPPPFPGVPRYTAAGLRRLFPGLVDPQVSKRHLRRGELPYLWRFLPLAVLERVMGRVVVLKAFQPVSAALDALDPAA